MGVIANDKLSMLKFDGQTVRILALDDPNSELFCRAEILVAQTSCLSARLRQFLLVSRENRARLVAPFDLSDLRKIGQDCVFELFIVNDGFFVRFGDQEFDFVVHNGTLKRACLELSNQRNFPAGSLREKYASMKEKKIAA